MDTGTTISRAWVRAFAMALLATGLQCPGASLAQCRDKAMPIPVKMVGHHAVATLVIDGRQVPLLVDTGVEFSMLTYAAASQLHLDVKPLSGGIPVAGPPDTIDAGTTQVPHIVLQDGYSMDNLSFVVEAFQPDAGAMGILGRSFLGIFDTEYDLAHGIVNVVFTNADCATTNRATWAAPGTVVSQVALPAATEDTNVTGLELRSTIELNGRKMTAVFDSGSRTLVSLDAAHRVGVADADMTRDGEAFDLRVGSTTQWLATFDKVDVGGEAIGTGQLEVVDTDLPADIKLGIDFFLSHHVYVSRQQSRMFFTANGGPVFALDHGDPADRDPDAPGDESLDLDDFRKRIQLELSRGLLADLAPPVAAAGSTGPDLDAAMAYFDRACALQPANADLVTMHALLHVAHHQPDLALADLDIALRLDPSHAMARVTRSGIYAQQGERDKAQADVATLDEQLAPQSDSRRLLATRYEELAMPAQALAQSDLWIANHPGAPKLATAYNNRCWYRAELNVGLDQALDDCDKAVTADGKNSDFLDSRAWTYLRMGDLQKALADFDSALAIGPTDAFSLYGRGLVHLALGDASAAQADLAAARQAQPNIDDAIRKDGLPLAPPP